jgi:hypothetical protein
MQRARTEQLSFEIASLSVLREHARQPGERVEVPRHHQSAALACVLWRQTKGPHELGVPLDGTP